MRRRTRGQSNELTTLPWPVLLAIGTLGFALIGYGAPAWFSGQQGQFAQSIAQNNPFTLFAWLCLALFAIAATRSFLDARQKRRLLDTRTNLDSIAALGWRDFERLVGEAFRRQGYSIEETGLGGADGGIDLILQRNGRRILVQCKQWRRDKVPVNVVREMYGLLAHHRADEVRIAAIGAFTADAASFAKGKPIRLIDGSALLAMIRSVQGGEPTAIASPAHAQAPATQPDTDRAIASASVAPSCPRCGTHMVQRTNRRTASIFWGCAGFPACRGTR